jgi:transposase
MNAYSKDLRLKVLSAVERGVPRREVARMLGISISTIARYVWLKTSGQEIAPKPSPGRTSKILADPDTTGAACSASSERTTLRPWKSIVGCSRRSGGLASPWPP